jgi:hypothetical protein
MCGSIDAARSYLRVHTQSHRLDYHGHPSDLAQYELTLLDLDVIAHQTTLYSYWCFFWLRFKRSRDSARKRGQRRAAVRNQAALSELVLKYQPGRLLTVSFDATKADDVVETFRKAKEAFGRIDVVFSNAAVGLMGEVEGSPEDVSRYLFDVNF